jgi:hypothetical protein
VIKFVSDCGFLQAPVSSTNKTDRHDIAKILLKVALNTINLNLSLDLELLTFRDYNDVHVFWTLSILETTKDTKDL